MNTYFKASIVGVAGAVAVNFIYFAYYSEQNSNKKDRFSKDFVAKDDEFNRSLTAQEKSDLKSLFVLLICMI